MICDCETGKEPNTLTCGPGVMGDRCSPMDVPSEIVAMGVIPPSEVTGWTAGQTVWTTVVAKRKKEDIITHLHIS